MYAIVTRYVRPDGKIVRHVYLADNGQPYTTRARALTQRKRLIEEQRQFATDVVLELALNDGTLEIDVVKIVDPT